MAQALHDGLVGAVHAVRGQCLHERGQYLGAVRAFVHESLREPFRRFDLAFLGAPLVGDPLYGGPEGDRVMLHAWWISVEGRRIEAPVPESFGPHVS